MNTKLIQLLTLFDIPMLESISSKGLVRRAEKDLEKGEISGILEETDSHILVQAQDAKVTIPVDDPKKSTCSCPASGICRHILAAIFYLQKKETQPRQESGEPNAIEPAWQEEPAADGEPIILEEAAQIPDDMQAEFTSQLMAFTEKDLRKWGGKRNFEEAFQLLGEIEEKRFLDNNRFRVLFPSKEISVTAVYIPGLTLDQFMVVGKSNRKEKKKDSEKSFVIAAVIEFQKERGIEWNLSQVQPDSLSSSAKVEGSPRSRLEVLKSVCGLFEEIVSCGIAHLSPAFYNRLTALSVSAAGVFLPRLSLELKSTADEVRSSIDRETRANSSNLMLRLSLCYALCTALQNQIENPPAYLVGKNRTVYESREPLEVFVVSAYRWETQSQYHGITLLMWDEADKQWYTWSDSRPIGQDNRFDPLSVYEGNPPWPIGCPFHKILGSFLRFTNVKTNTQNRISSSQDLKVERIKEGVAFPSFEPVCFVSWEKLGEYIQRINLPGLDTGNPLKDIIIIKPSKWGKKGFEQIVQSFYWELEDEKGESLVLAVPYNEINKGSIEILEEIVPWRDGVSMIVGKILHNKDGKGIIVHPLSLLREGSTPPIIHLTLDSPETVMRSTFISMIKKVWQKQKDGVKGFRISLFEEEENQEVFCDSRVQQVQVELLNLSKIGVVGGVESRRDVLKEYARVLEEVSLTVLSRGISSLVEANENPAAELLKGYYLCHLHNQVFGFVMNK